MPTYSKAHAKFKILIFDVQFPKKLEIGSGLVPFLMIFEILQSELIRRELNSQSFLRLNNGPYQGSTDRLVGGQESYII